MWSASRVSASWCVRASSSRPRLSITFRGCEFSARVLCNFYWCHRAKMLRCASPHRGNITSATSAINLMDFSDCLVADVSGKPNKNPVNRLRDSTFCVMINRQRVTSSQRSRTPSEQRTIPLISGDIQKLLNNKQQQTIFEPSCDVRRSQFLLAFSPSFHFKLFLFLPMSDDEYLLIIICLFSTFMSAALWLVKVLLFRVRVTCVESAWLLWLLLTLCGSRANGRAKLTLKFYTYLLDLIYGSAFESTFTCSRGVERKTRWEIMS